MASALRFNRAGVRHRQLGFVACALVLLCATGHETRAGAPPEIAITSVPAYATAGFVDGMVSGVDVASHRVTAYIHIEGSGWWIKPSELSPTVSIDPDGTFQIDVVGGGLDDRATILCVALLAAGVDPPSATGSVRIPASLDSVAIDCEERYGRIIEFAGLPWAVKEAPAPVGPGSNRFSDRSEDVFVDGDGLHLTIRFHDGEWWATEVILLESPGFGIYSFQTASELDDLDVNATFGAFTWDPWGDGENVPGAPNREIDFEDSRWGDPLDPNSSQAVVQPYHVAGNLHRYALLDLSGDPALTRFLEWAPERIDFTTLGGFHTPFDFDGAPVVDEFTYIADPGANHFVPDAGRAAFRFNLWLNDVASGPANGTEIEVVVRDFQFVGSGCVLDVDDSGSVDVATDVVYIARSLLGLTPVPSSFRAADPSIPADAIIRGRIEPCLQ